MVLGLVIFGCQDAEARFVFEARVVDGDNGNPVAETDATVLRIGVREGDLPPQEDEYPITDGRFEAVLEFASFTRLTRVRVEMVGPTTELLTAPPAFVPSATRGFMRVVAGEPSSCETVSFTALQAPRSFFGMTRSGTFALIIGGVSPSDEQVEFLDALEWEARPFAEELSLSSLGATRSVSIDEGQILVVPENTAPFVFDMLDPLQRITQLVLHNGAGPRSGLVSVPGVGAMVIGGEVAGVPVSAVSLVDPDLQVTALELDTPRSLPAAVALGTDVLVAGGNDEGTAEILSEGGATGSPVAGLADGVRDSGLLVGDRSSRALWMGGTDSGGGVRQDTVRFEDCPATCDTLAGPAWTNARLDAVQPPPSALIIGGDGSALVEGVQWDGDEVGILPVLELGVARAGAGAIVLESGAFFVAGGDDGSSIRDDFEFCLPAALSPL